MNANIYESIYIGLISVHTVFPVATFFHSLCICFVSLRFVVFSQKRDR
jgi:hypothetical protein